MDGKAILERLEMSRRELLDLSYRNRLLNYRELAARGVQVVDELSAEVLRILYAEQKPMTFAPLPEPQEGEAEQATDEDDLLEQFLASHREAQAVNVEVEVDGVAERHRDRILQTKYLDSVLERRLLNTYYLARSSIEEQGVNTLFLALGMLKWIDPAQPGKPLEAPLVLLPVELQRKSARAEFTLRYNGDELGANVSLQAKLKSDLGIDWPIFNDPESPSDFDIAAYFEQCRAVAAEQDDWRVEPNAIQLGFFSFHKYVMYRDLDPKGWPESAQIEGHPVVSGLLGDAGFPREEPVIPGNTPLDEVLDYRNVFHVIEADSSQAEVIAEVASGKSMVIQGPPGTGKSQTITNLIAQAVAKGQSVLFVAEKLAALEVVKRRLDNLGLGDVALELHSNKASKRQVLETLRETWEQGAPKDPGFEELYRQFTASMNELNRHAAEINRPVFQSGRSLYLIFGRMMALRRALDAETPPALGIEGWTEWSGEQFDHASRLAEQLGILVKEIGLLAEHPFRDAQVTAVLPHDLPEIAAAARETDNALDEFLGAIRALTGDLGIEREVSLQEADELAARLISMADWPDMTGLATAHPAWASQKEKIERTIQSIEMIQSTTAELGAELTDAAWSDPDVEALHKCLGEYTGKWYRWIFPTYRAASKKAAALWRIRPPFRLERRLACLESILKIRPARANVETNQQAMRVLFGVYWQGEQSKVETLRSISRWLHELHTSGLATDLVNALAERLAAGRSAKALAGRVDALKVCGARYDTFLDALTKRLEIRQRLDDPDRTFRSNSQYGPERSFGPAEAGTTNGFPPGFRPFVVPPLGGKSHTENCCTFRDYPPQTQKSLLIAWAQNPAALLPISRYNAMRSVLKEHGLLPLMAAASAWPAAGALLRDLLEYRWCEALLKAYLLAHPGVNQFSPGLADRWVAEFRQADVAFLQRNRVRVLREHHARLPSRHGGAGEMAILNREFNKRARHMPIRKLFTEAGRAIQRAKPVMMMSPFSVATYLPRGTLPFDLVIFDEASQVRPVDAFGAIARARQVIVVGDSRQLPPTTFFDRMQPEELEEESQTRDIESILKQFDAKGAFSSMLRWHYRSRHNSLIDYSNHGFYGERLTVFPAPHAERNAAGLSFVHVPDGVYQRGKARARNPIEAQRVADRVMEHARTRPHLSLGVGAFSVAQMQEILDCVEILRRQNPDCEAFFYAHPDEPFFVKNLENIQGDERDVIFISVGYGRDENGSLLMNFGPLIKEGGERRLNVLITRAKLQCVVFSNFTADQIDLNRTQSEGVRHLKAYLQFAEKGRLAVAAPTGREPDSPFEIEVASALRTLGYDVHHQVGSAGYFIDLALVDPTTPGRYLLGIECDGATYHSSRWARDRDRLRQMVLEGLGWSIHRIWSKSWFEDPATELRKVKEAIERAAIPPAATVPDLKTAPPPPPVAVIEREAPAHTDSELDEPLPYRIAELRGPAGVTDFESVKGRDIAAWLQKVIEVEAPVHIEEAMKRVLSASEVSRLGSRIRATFEEALQDLARKGRIRLEGDFAWTPDATTVRVRDRSDPRVSSRIEHVPPEELERAFRMVVSASCSIQPEDLFRETLRMFGMGALTHGRRDHLETALQKAIAAGLFQEQGDRIVAASAGPAHS